MIVMGYGYRMSGVPGDIMVQDDVKDWYPPNYPVPAIIGAVQWIPKDRGLIVIIPDCDESFDPRLCIAIVDGVIYDDYPHNSPNYR